MAFCLDFWRRFIARLRLRRRLVEHRLYECTCPNGSQAQRHEHRYGEFRLRRPCTGEHFRRQARCHDRDLRRLGAAKRESGPHRSCCQRRRQLGASRDLCHRQRNRERQTTPDQPGAQTNPAPFQPAFDRTRRPAEPAGGLLLAESLDAAEHNGRSIRLGEPADLFVQRDEQFAGRQRGKRIGSGVGRLVCECSRLTASRGSCPKRKSPRDRMQPGRQACIASDRSRPPGQYQKASLKSILGNAIASQHAPAEVQDHGAMPRDQRGKSVLVASADISGQQFGIGFRGRSHRNRQPAQMPQYRD